MTWEDRWRDGNTPWDAGAPSPTVLRLRDALPRGRALIAGCGSGHDVFALAGPERHVTALDIAPSAADVFESTRVAAECAREHVHFEVADFFTYTATPFDLIWDYTFLCAIDRDLREDWADQVASLLRTGGVFASLIFPVFDAPADYSGPPWPLSPSLVEDLLVPRGFGRVSMAPAHASFPSREGKEWAGVFKKR